jgi:hypothetical protein
VQADDDTRRGGAHSLLVRTKMQRTPMSTYLTYG